jgi:hypothetical protein
MGHHDRATEQEIHRPFCAWAPLGETPSERLLRAVPSNDSMEMAVGTRALRPPCCGVAGPVCGPDEPVFLDAGPDLPRPRAVPPSTRKGAHTPGADSTAPLTLLADGCWRSNLQRVLAVTRRYFEAPLPAPATSALDRLSTAVGERRATRSALRGFVVDRGEYVWSKRVGTGRPKRPRAS